MAFNIFATATSDIPLANLDANFTLIGAAAAASTLYPTATTSITYGTAGTTHNFSGSGLAVTGTLSATKASTGDVITFGSSGGNTGYLGSTASLISLLYGASGSGAGFYATSSVAAIISADQSKSAVISNTGLAVTGLISSTGTNGILRLLDGNTAGGVKIGAYNAAFTANGYLAFEGYSSEYGRFDSSGNLGIGITSPSQKLTVNAIATISDPASSTSQLTFGDAASDFAGRIFYSHSADAMQFFVNAAERARIDSSGNLLVGATATISAGPTSRVISYAGSASTAAISAQYGNSYTGQLYRADSLTTSGTGWSYFMGLSGNGTSITTTQIQILGNGNIQNTNNSYGAISDIKRKENITDATPKLEKLNQVRVVNFNMIGEEQKQLGVIAQELEQVFPSMIEETPDRDVEGNDIGTTTKSVKYSVFVPMLIKAIQEQQAIITALTTRITALEAK